MLPTSCFILGILQNEAKAIDEAYFAAPITPALETGRTGTITLSLTIETSSIVEITKDGANWEEINNGVAIAANKEFIHKFAALTGDSINFRSKTAGNVRRAIVQVDSQEGPANSISSASSGPDTPWTVDHDAAGFRLLNLLVMESNAAIPAAAGAIRLGDTERIAWRSSSDIFDIYIESNGFAQLNTNASLDFASGGKITGPQYLEIEKVVSPAPAQSGEIRLSNTDKISWRNFANTADFAISLSNTNLFNFERGIVLGTNPVFYGNSSIFDAGDADGFQFRTYTGNKFNFKINAVDEYNFNAAEADWLGNALRNFGFVESNAATPADAGAIRLGNTELISWRNFADTNNHSITFNGSDLFVIALNTIGEYSFSSAEADWAGNTLRNVGFLESAVTPHADFGAVRLGNSESIEWRNFADTGDHFIFFSSSDQLLIGFNDIARYGFTAAEADWAGQSLRNFGFIEDSSPNPANTGTIRLGVNNSIRWRNNANNNNHHIRFSSSDDFVIDVNNVDEYGFGATRADFGSNSLINVLFFESDATNPAASGALRLGNAEQFNWRNAANSADIGLVANSSNLLAFVGSLLLDSSIISNHSSLGSVDPAADFFLVLDATDGIVKKAIPNNFGLGGSVITRISGNSGAAGSEITLQHKTATQSHTSTTPDVDLTTTGVGVGTWHFKYVVIFHSAATTTGLRLAVNHTGTTGTFVMRGTFTSTGGTAATGIHDQILTSATAGLTEAFAERVKNTTSKATAGVGTANADQMVIIEGTIIVTVSGSLELKIGTEVAASAITTQIGTFMELIKIA